MVLVLTWIISGTITRLMHKETVMLYGANLHNRVKPLMVLLISIPIVMNDMYINLTLLSSIILILMLGCIVVSTVVRNKMLETVPMHVMQTTVVIVYIETFIIDMLIGTVPTEAVVVFSILTKAVGTYHLVKSDEGVERRKDVCKALILISTVTIVRMYSLSWIMVGGHISRGWVVMLSQLSIILYTNIKHRKEKLKLNKDVITKYIPQVLLTTVNEYIYTIMVASGVNKTVGIDILGMVLLMLIETRLRISKHRWAGISLIILGWMLTLI